MNRSLLLGASSLAIAGPAAVLCVAQPSQGLDDRWSAAVSVDSGPVASAGPNHELRLVYSTQVIVPGASWVRLYFADVELSGLAGANGARLRVVSELDGDAQWLDADSLAQAGNSSAYFNGGSVTVELHSYGGTGRSRFRVARADAGIPYGGRSLCGPFDYRVPSGEGPTTRPTARLG
jgi:hypothetical protein